MTDRPARAAAPKKPGIYSRGSETVDAILKAALQVLIEEGASAFTLRRIAQQCGLNVGNVSRHFPRKEMLVQVLLEELLSGAGFDGRSDLPAEEALALIIGGSFDQLSTKSMTHLFIELWAMANHNDFVADRVEASYRYVHDMIAPFVAELNPALTPAEVDAVSLYINATIEGSTMLAGFGKPWSSMMPQMKAIAVKSLVHVAKTITSQDIRALPVKSREPGYPEIALGRMLGGAAL